jgi:hypothetical protein
MNERETERRLQDWLDAQAPALVPDGLRRAVAAVPVAVPPGWPDRLAEALGPRLAAVPRLAWTLLMMTALLAAVIAAMLVGGSQPVRPLPAVEVPTLPVGTPPPRVSVSLGPVPTCAPGSRPDEPGPVDQARPPSYGAIAFDRASGKIVLVAGREGSGRVETWTFDVCTNTWAEMHPASEPEVGWLGMLTYDTAARQTISVFNPGGVWAYDLASDTWTMRAGAPATSHLRLAYDSAAARVVALQVGSPHRLWSLDRVAGVWRPVYQGQDVWPIPSDSDLHILLAYDASVDRLVGYEHGEVRLFDLGTGTWTPPGAASPPFDYGGYWSNGGEIAYDEVAQRTVLFSNGHVIAYDAATDHWETLYGKDYTFPDECGIHPECRSQPWMVYDPINERFVVYGGNVHATPAGYYPSDDVLAFDTQTREWSVLLARSDGQPVPGT